MEASIFKSYYFKGLYKKYIELRQFNSKNYQKANKLNEKWAKHLNRYFTKEDIYMVCEKVFNISNNQGNANVNHNEI